MTRIEPNDERTEFEGELSRRLAVLADTAPETPSRLGVSEPVPLESSADHDPAALLAGADMDTAGRARQWPRSMVAAAAMLLVAVGGLGLWAALSDRSEPSPTTTAGPTPTEESTTSIETTETTLSNTTEDTVAEDTVDEDTVDEDTVDEDTVAGDRERGEPGRVGDVTGIEVEPSGPYQHGQVVTLRIAARDGVDLLNGSVRFCGRAAGASDEYCDPVADGTIQVVTTNPGEGHHEVTYELTRHHFGPLGWNDCDTGGFVCRFVVRANEGLLTSMELSFEGAPEPRAVTMSIIAGDEVGQFVVTPSGIEADPDPLSFVSERELDWFTKSGGTYDPELAVLSWSLGDVCTFGDAEAPIGSEALTAIPGWWPVRDDSPLSTGTLDPETGLTTHLSPNCDGSPYWPDHSDDPAISVSDPNRPLDVRRYGDVFGYQGRQSCAASTCFIYLSASVFHPIPGGGSTSFGHTITAALLPAIQTESHPAPEISILEPPPYRAGQTVTVEVANVVLADGTFAPQTMVGWCEGGDSLCGFRFAQPVTSDPFGRYRVEWTLPAGTDCGLTRCYFKIDSRRKGLMPPAVVMVPIVDG